MRIQTSDTLATPDTEKVLRVLEWSLRDISVEVLRNGGRITVCGLGPSQRTMNRNDITVVEVTSENDHTVIRADITFLASALLGGVPQDDLVRSKLDRVLDRVKMELGTKSVRGEASPRVSDSVYEAGDGEARHIFAEAELVAAHSVEPAPSGVAEHIVAAESVRVPEPEAVAEAESAAALQGVNEVSSERVVTPPVELPVVPVAGVSTQELKSTGTVAASSPVAVSRSSGHRRAIPIFQSFHSEEAETPRRWGLLATVVCMLAAVALFLAWPYLVGLVHERLAPASSVSDQSTAESTKLSDDKTPMQGPDANTAAARDAAIHTESDPRVWLESWADALRGQDAGAQASFYADPVEHYALKSNVSNADVWLNKQNAIQSRPKSWTVRLENVAVEPRPDESMRVRLTKHYTWQSGEGRVSERFVPSQLKLRKIDGQWKITSEQNLRP